MRHFSRNALPPTFSIVVLTISPDEFVLGFRNGGVVVRGTEHSRGMEGASGDPVWRRVRHQYFSVKDLAFELGGSRGRVLEESSIACSSPTSPICGICIA